MGIGIDFTGLMSSLYDVSYGWLPPADVEKIDWTEEVAKNISDRNGRAAWYRQQALKQLNEKPDAWTQAALAAGKILDKIDSGAKKVLGDKWEFFKKWWSDDPVGATAGGILVVAGGVVLGRLAIGGILKGFRGASQALFKARNLLGIVGAVPVIGSLIRFAIRGTQYLWQFNWNITDKQIRQQQEGLLRGLYAQAGAALGSGAASLLCGTAPVALASRSKMVRVNPAAIAMIKELTEFDPQSDNYGEIYEEFMANLKALVGMGTRAALQAAFLESYKNIRKWIKNFSASSVGKAVLPQKWQQTIAKWGEESSQPWSFASAFENWVESIEDKNLQAFTEEFFEEFMDICSENLMAISYVF